MLTTEQKSFYEKNGFLFPLSVLTTAQVVNYRALFDTYTIAHYKELADLLPRARRKIYSLTHFALPWVYEIVSNDRVLDAVAGVIGPDILVWESNWFVKFPGDGSFISWHQDGAYWGLSPPNVTTAWIALGPSVEANGCMRVIAGTHNTAFPQRDTYSDRNALSRGQEIAVNVDEAAAINLELRPGEMSLHHIGIAHSSRANASDIPRVGLAVRYIAPEVVQRGSERQYALLVRGKDRHGHFEIIAPPRNGTTSEEVRQEAERRLLSNVLPKN